MKNFKEKIDYLKSRVIKIVCPDFDSKGTGFFISKKGHIATNFHVVGRITNKSIEYSKDIQITGLDFKNKKASIVHDQSNLEAVLHDWAIIKTDLINSKDFEYIEFDSYENCNEGDDIFFGGFPLTQENLTVHRGYISSKRETFSRFAPTVKQRLIDIDATVVGGNSGGPLIIEKKDKLSAIGIISQQVALLTEAFQQLEDYLRVQMTNPSSGAVFISGVNPNAALFELIKVLKSNISTGIGTAISIEYIKKEFDKLNT